MAIESYLQTDDAWDVTPAPCPVCGQGAAHVHHHRASHAVRYACLDCGALLAGVRVLGAEEPYDEIELDLPAGTHGVRFLDGTTRVWRLEPPLEADPDLPALLRHVVEAEDADGPRVASAWYTVRDLRGGWRRVYYHYRGGPRFASAAEEIEAGRAPFPDVTTLPPLRA